MHFYGVLTHKTVIFILITFIRSRWQQSVAYTENVEIIPGETARQPNQFFEELQLELVGGRVY